MLTPEEARKIDPALKKWSKRKLMKALELLETLAELAVEDYLRGSNQDSSEEWVDDMCE
jgi:hypothetical protein